MRSFLEESKAQALAYYLEECRESGVSTNVLEIRTTIMRRLNLLQYTAQQRQAKVLQGDVERYWYTSLTRGAPAYEVYDTDFYLAEVFAGWRFYSRRYLLALKKALPALPVSVQRPLQQAQRVLDLGCGMGYTTAAFHEVLPQAQCYGTNIADTKQFRLATLLGQRYHFTVLPSPLLLPGRAEVIFACDYFEHIAAPIEHLQAIIAHCAPQVIITANSFNATAVGHFNAYTHGQAVIAKKDVTRHFHAALRRAGYVKGETRFWNNRPMVWVKTNG